MADRPQILLFHYPFSPWSQKITSYLAFRAIPYTECHQPVTMPRPDLARLGVKYRRIPLVAIGLVGATQQFPLGGTSILIAVGVGLDTVKQIESQLQQRNYEGFLR